MQKLLISRVSLWTVEREGKKRQKWFLLLWQNFKRHKYIKFFDIKKPFPFDQRVLDWHKKIHNTRQNICIFANGYFCQFKFYYSRKNHFRLDKRLRKWPFSAKISLQLQGLIMWCFLVLGHCDKIHLRVEGVFCPVSISVPVHNCLKQFLKDHFRIW